MNLYLMPYVLLSSPHDVLATLLNNLKVQERQNRVCTTVAIAIVAETCSPFTVLPGLMNEYRVSVFSQAFKGIVPRDCIGLKSGIIG